MMDLAPDMNQRALKVAFPPKPPINCLYSGMSDECLHGTKAALVFTHGAGGTLQTATIVNFTYGFISASTRPSLLSFQGNMNLASRIKMFAAVLEARATFHEEAIEISPACLGGRSMGARAAVKAATKETTHLVLVSYPLHTGKEVRDQVLLGLPESVKVIFVSGDRDEMCDLQRLENVRVRMKCKTWRVIVQGADHGMNVRPKSATQFLGRKSGGLVAEWLEHCDENLTEGMISWNTDLVVAEWSGWHKARDISTASPQDAATLREATVTPAAPATEASDRKRRKNPHSDQGHEEPSGRRSKKVRKR